MNWGKSIVLTFVLFAGFIGSMVFWMTRQRVDLVRDDYYQDEIKYQQHIDRVVNTARLGAPVSMTYEAARQEVAFTLAAAVQKGEVTFYRPADRRLDVHQTLMAGPAGARTVSTAKLASGFWKVQISWSDGEHDYYAEKELVL
ncbi:nitrogen fixation protein FixH [Rudanella paleaurantiibacter]|uniref:Nitrogen fixation protein FixH n=1 Tax=Rudanella paleaurantiibacter TaxID=2614655 RepID=A0A7J5TWN8_9BACT|nr:FixH family protein [Rudanella paleaurantiibacter]KAB7727682.1 nitrogen fixation protein FixH [Rudanella paleaurantiibacter]